MRADPDSDLQAIRALIGRQFASMSWNADGAPDWAGFKNDFIPDAQLFPSARPLKAQSLSAFVDRINGLVGTTLRSLQEVILGTKVQVFGNVAVAVVAGENNENETDINRVVEMMLLVKDQGTWKIVAQAWDKEREDNSISTFTDRIALE